MKKLVMLISILMTVLMNGTAQEVMQLAGDMVIRDLLIEIKDDRVVISFGVDIGHKAVGRNSTAQIIPVIGTEEDEIRLHGIVIEGRGAELSRKRRWMEPDAPEGSILTTNDATVDYSASLPLDSVKVGSDLRLEVSIDGCSTVKTGTIVLAEKFMG
jgi:hypothetical protein